MTIIEDFDKYNIHKWFQEILPENSIINDLPI
jgi:hypothetical protein